MQYLTQSCAFALKFQLMKSDGLTPLDLSESTVSFIVKRNKTDVDAVLPVQQWVQPRSHIIDIFYDATQTADIEEGAYICGLKISTPEHGDDEVWADTLIVQKGVF